MIFFLSSMPKRTFILLENIFKMYSQGKLKDQVVTKSKKGICSFPEMKGSAFKPFRGLELDTIHDILEEIDNKKCSFKEATTKCSDIKALQKVQSAFIRATNCENWEQAVQHYPLFTTVEKLEPFKHLDFTNSRKVPEKFFAYCQQIKEGMNDQQSVVNEDHDNYFFISHRNSLGLLWKTNMLEVHPESIDNTLKIAKVLRCSGFHLSILDLIGDDEVCV